MVRWAGSPIFSSAHKAIADPSSSSFLLLFMMIKETVSNAAGSGSLKSRVLTKEAGKIAATNLRPMAMRNPAA